MDIPLLLIRLISIFEKRFCLLALLLEVLSGQAAPGVFGKLKRVVGYAIEIQPVDRRFLPRGQLRHKCRAGRRVLQGQRTSEDLFEQLCAFTRGLAGQRWLRSEPGAGFGVKKPEAAELTNSLSEPQWSGARRIGGLPLCNGRRVGAFDMRGEGSFGNRETRADSAGRGFAQHRVAD